LPFGALFARNDIRPHRVIQAEVLNKSPGCLAWDQGPLGGANECQPVNNVEVLVMVSSVPTAASRSRPSQPRPVG
jgi:hypothetical protein